MSWFRCLSSPPPPGRQTESVSLDELCQLFLREFGYRLSAAMYGAASLRDLVSVLLYLQLPVPPRLAHRCTVAFSYSLLLSPLLSPFIQLCQFSVQPHLLLLHILIHS